MPSTLDWLRARDDRALVALLRARPDLTVPAPGDLTVLAGRLNTGPSVWRAMESLNQFHIQVLQALAVLGAEKRAVGRSDLRGLLGDAGPGRRAGRGARPAGGLALVRGDRADPHAVRGARRARPVPGRTRLARHADGRRRRRRRCEEPGPDLARHPRPAGHRDPPRNDRPDSPIARAVTALIAGRPAAPGRPGHRRAAPRGRDGAARRRAARPIQVSPPAGHVRSSTASRTVDGTGGGQALATVDRLGRLLDAIGQSPPPALKSGGLGIRELRRLAKSLGTDEPITALDVELLAARRVDRRGRLPRAGSPNPGPRPRRPTTSWTDRTRPPGRSSPTVWLDLRRNPSRAGTRDASDKVQNALSPELSWIRGPAERRFVLRALAELPPGLGSRSRRAVRPAGLAVAAAAGRAAGGGDRRHHRRGDRARRRRLRRADHRRPRAARRVDRRTPRPRCERPCRSPSTR